MSRENVEVVRRVLGAMSADVAERDTLDTLVKRLAPEVEFEEDPRFPEAGTYRGRDEVFRYFSEFAAQFEEFLFTVEELRESGDDTVLVLLRIRGRGKASSAQFDFRSGWLYSLRDGQVVRIRAYLDRAEALEAVGLRE
jgi:ketosteroid isomerase-like protein